MDKKRIYDEGTPDILVDNGTIYVTFHGASNTHGTVFGYRGIATTTDFITYTKAADDCIFSYLDAKDWNVDWNRNGSVGGGAAAYIKDGEYWYTLIESPDISLACVEGQNWPFGLLRSKSLTSTQWENWQGNPLPEFTPVGPAVQAGAIWVYPTMFEDGGITYLAASQGIGDPAYRQFRLVWKDNITQTLPQPETTTVDTTPAPQEITGTVFEADMTSTNGWTLQHKVPAGVKGSFTCDDGMYILAEDEISIPLEIDLTRNPRFSITVENMKVPRLFVRLQFPELPPQPGYNSGYIGFEALQYDGVSTFDINEELNWMGYYDENEKGIKSCILNIWAHQTTVTISDIHIDYYG